MIDYKLKAEVLKTNLPKRLNKLDRQNYLNCKEGIVFDQTLEYQYFDLSNEFGAKFIKEARKINNASYRRVERLKQRITEYINTFPCVWLTLTFNDDTLNNTTRETRRKYVSRFLKSISRHYVANIDFGEDDRFTHREHYHAIAIGKLHKKDLAMWTNQYGYTWIETINRSSNPVKISKYISKLTNHAIKKSTKRQVYIYSRNRIEIPF